MALNPVVPRGRWSRRTMAWGLVWMPLCAIFVSAVCTARAGCLPLSDKPIETRNDRVVALGSQLFESPLLSADRSISCRSCHIPAYGYSGDRPQAVGIGGVVGRRRAPALMRLQPDGKLMWDGRAPGLRAQIAMPLESSEMAVRWDDAIHHLNEDQSLSRAAKDAGIANLDRGTIIRALATFVASIGCEESRFDRFYFSGETTALTTQEQKGFRLFIHKAHCSSCHLINGAEAPFTDGSFHNTGIGRWTHLNPDRGRAAITQDPKDEGAFKTPSLRGVALRPFLMHDGRFTSLRSAIENYDHGTAAYGADIDTRLRPLFLEPAEIDAMVAFLNALTPDQRPSMDSPTSKSP